MCKRNVFEDDREVRAVLTLINFLNQCLLRALWLDFICQWIYPG